MESVIRDNLSRVREQITVAAHRVGRDPDEIRLVGVTKYVDEVFTRELATAGCLDLGESRPQQLCAKAEALADLSARWHLIGHLQRNKIRRLLPHTHLIHSGDSMRLLRSIDQIASELDLRAKVLLEVNISGDPEKHGFVPDDLRRELPAIAQLAHIDVQGLMAMGSRVGGPEQAGRDFAAARQLQQTLQQESPPNVSLVELSLGMSGDFAQAIAEGSTFVRIGSALWEGLPT